MKPPIGSLFALVASAALASCGSAPDKSMDAQEAAVEAPTQDTGGQEAAVATTPAAAPTEQADAAAEEAKEPEKETQKETPAADNKAAAAAPTAEAAPAPMPSATAAPEVAAAAITRPAAFGQCAVCHSDKKGQKSGFGPNLFGVAGTRSGDLGDYSFSPAMKAAGVVWNRDTLDRFIEAPQAVVPGTKMAFAGIKDPAKRKAVVDYLLALK